jgi:hypothetical protein
MEFRKWLQESVGGTLSSFIRADGTIDLFHFSNASAFSTPGGKKKVVTLNPKMVGANSYSRNDMQATSIPRVFFYLTVSQRERIVQGSLYRATVPANLIYDLLEDPLLIKKKLRDQNGGVLNMTALLNAVKKAGFKGAYYQPGFHVVIWFSPIKATLVPDEQRAVA